MRLRFGKGDWIELRHIPLEFRVERGTRFFGGTGDAARAAAVATRAVARMFVAPSVREARAAPGAAAADPAELKAAAADRVEAAVFQDPDGKLRVVYREVVIRFEPGVDDARRKALLARYGLDVRRENPFRDDQIVAFDPGRKYLAERMVELANELTETEEVVFAFPNFVSEFRRAAVPKPNAAQWHLKTVKAASAWAVTQGEGITVAIIDDGVDINHPNLKGNIRRNPDPGEPKDKFGRDFFLDDDLPGHFDPRPKSFSPPYDETDTNDIHGTPCAGVAAASGKRDKVFGIAPKAKILAVKIFHGEELADEGRVANAIRYASRYADVLSCSWDGPESPDIESALEGAGAGRGGKGCPVFGATGNELAAKVGYPARSKFAIGVGASTDEDKLADYSNRGREVSMVAPAEGSDLNIFTTDVGFPNRGYNLGTDDDGGADGLHTNDFNGTSSATPLAAGIAALVLSVYPKLTRGEVRDLLQETADKIGPPSSYAANGHSRKFGFGRVNAAKAVAEARKRAEADSLAGASTRRRRAGPKSAAASRAAAKARKAPSRAGSPGKTGRKGSPGRAVPASARKGAKRPVPRGRAGGPGKGRKR